MSMDCKTITVHWHDDNQPVYSVDFQPLIGSTKKSERLATGGGDNNIRIWRVTYMDGDENNVSIEHLSTLRKHTQAVNVVRFDPMGKLLATAGDDGALILWTLSDLIVKDFGAEEDEEIKESWIAKHVLRSSNSEIYDISWSPDSKFIITGSMDNVTRVYSADTGQQVYQLSDHSHYVQGVTWDPKNELLATQSADRSVCIYSLGNSGGEAPSLDFKISKSDMPVKSPLKGIPNDNEVPSTRRTFLYHSETLQSFFRRLTFSPDGSLLVTPSGIYKPANDNGSKKSRQNDSDDNISPSNTIPEDKEGDENSSDDFASTVYIYIRSGLKQSPICHLPGLSKPAIAVKFSPVLYVLPSQKTPPVFNLPYKMVFAVATQDSILVYDTVHLQPLGLASNLQYSVITDLAWDRDGQSLIVSSADGFCSNITFQDKIFGEIYDLPLEDKKQHKTTSKSEYPSILTSLKKLEHKENKPTELINVDDITIKQNNKPELIDVENVTIKQRSESIKDDKGQSVSDENKNSQNKDLEISDDNRVKKRRIAPTLVTN